MRLKVKTGPNEWLLTESYDRMIWTKVMKVNDNPTIFSKQGGNAFDFDEEITYHSNGDEPCSLLSYIGVVGIQMKDKSYYRIVAYSCDAFIVNDEGKTIEVVL